MFKQLSKLTQSTALSSLVFLSAATPVNAGELSISNTPLFLGTSVQPNVFFLLDDSGSMDWEILTTKHWFYPAYDPDLRHNGSYDSFDYGWDMIDNGLLYAWGGNQWGDWRYMFNQSNAYGNNCSGGNTMERCTSSRPAEFDWRFRTFNLNVTFYNPGVNYKPWNGPCGPSNEICTDGDYRAALNNPKSCGTCKAEPRDLATDGDTENGPFKYDVWVDDSGYTGSRPLRGENFNETGVAAGAAAAPNGIVDIWDTHLRFSVGVSGVTVSRITYDPRTTAEGSRGLNETETVLGTLSSAGACYNILGSASSVVAIHNEGAAPNIGATGAPDCRTIAQTQTNIANWYQYSRRRMYTAKSAVSQVIDAQPKFRYGITKFKGQGSLFIEVPDVSVTDVTSHNFNLKDEMYADKQEGIGTFLAGGLDSVGTYFSDSLGGKTNPIKHSCQKNFQIVFTDGYWNDSTNSYGDVDGDGLGNTGADIAYKYFKYDLNPTIEDNVIPDSGSEADLDADGDGRTWQHLVSFTVAFGVQGNMSDADGDGWPDADASGSAWPGDGTPVKSGNWGDPVTCSNCASPDKIDDLWHMAWNTNGTYAAASTPEEVVEKLIAAITNIAGRVGSAAAVALNSGTLNANTRVYQAKFNSIDWSGDLQSVPIKDNDGDTSNDPAVCAGKTPGEVCGVEWSASEKLEARNYTSRSVFTRNEDTDEIVVFKSLTDLGTNQIINMRTHPDTGVLESDVRGQERMDWVLGRSDFGYDDGYRKRTVGDVGVMKLGDIIASSPVYVGEPSFLYPDSMEAEKYSTFRADNKNRTRMVYVGANDGMFHGFDASNGEEKFAFIPGKLVNKLNELTSAGYKKNHQYFIDGSPVTFDAYDGSWKSLVASSAGAGGQLAFALDVTNPDSFSASKVLWEFTDEDDADMGYSMGDLTYAKLNNGDWAVFVGNGYNNTEPDGNVSTTGNGVIYVLNAFTGEIIRKFDTGIGTEDDPYNPGSDRPNGISTVTPIDLDGDLTADYLYAGDLFGNVWKVDLTSSSSAAWNFAYTSGSDAKPMFKAVDGAGKAQPITAGVSVKRHPTKRDQTLVLFGTGKYFEVGDGVTSSSSQIQTFYSVWDDNSGDQYERVDMLEQKIVTELDTDGDGMTDWRVTTDENDPTGDYKIDWETHKGWFIDLRYSSGTEYGEQVVRKAVLRNNRVIFVTTVPDGDPCGYGGSSWIMEIDADSGSRLPESPFDTNGDGIIDDTDLFDIAGEQAAVSGTRSKEGIVATPGILNDPDADEERKYFSGTSGNIDVVVESSNDEFMKRQSWRQLK